MISKSIHRRSAAEIQDTLRQSMADGFTPTLAIIFISVEQDRKAISEIFKENNPLITKWLRQRI